MIWYYGLCGFFRSRKCVWNVFYIGLVLKILIEFKIFVVWLVEFYIGRCEYVSFVLFGGNKNYGVDVMYVCIG